MKKTNDWFVYRLGKPRRKLLGEVKATDREDIVVERIDPAQQAAAKDRFERFEALACHIDDGIKAAISAFNAEEQARGWLPTTPDEINKALAEVLAMTILDPTDEVDLEVFIENLHLSRSPDRAETI